MAFMLPMPPPGNPPLRPMFYPISYAITLLQTIALYRAPAPTWPLILDFFERHITAEARLQDGLQLVGRLRAAGRDADCAGACGRTDAATGGAGRCVVAPACGRDAGRGAAARGTGPAGAFRSSSSGIGTSKSP